MCSEKLTENIQEAYEIGVILVKTCLCLYILYVFKRSFTAWILFSASACLAVFVSSGFLLYLGLFFYLGPATIPLSPVSQMGVVGTLGNT